MELSSKVELQEKEIKELSSGIAALSERLAETEREVSHVRSKNDRLVADRENILAEIQRLKSAALVFFALLAIAYFLR